MRTQRYSATCTEKTGRAKATLLQIRDAVVVGERADVNCGGICFVSFCSADAGRARGLGTLTAGRGNQSLASSDDMGKNTLTRGSRCETPRVLTNLFPPSAPPSVDPRSSCFRLQTLDSGRPALATPLAARRIPHSSGPPAHALNGAPGPAPPTPMFSVRNDARLPPSDLLLSLRVRSVLSGSCCVKSAGPLMSLDRIGPAAHHSPQHRAGFVQHNSTASRACTQSPSQSSPVQSCVGLVV